MTNNYFKVSSLGRNVSLHFFVSFDRESTDRARAEAEASHERVGRKISSVSVWKTVGQMSVPEIGQVRGGRAMDLDLALN